MEKLVRDKIPQKMADEKQFNRYRIADPWELPGLKRNKLREEVIEVADAMEDAGMDDDSFEDLVDELVDVTEVLRSMGFDVHSASEIVEERRIMKKRDKGGFEYGIVMEFSKS